MAKSSPSCAIITDLWVHTMGENIRSTAKAIILRDGKVLLNRSFNEHCGEYFSLPGGGQNRFEPLEKTILRECLEETGLHVRVLRMAAVCEEIWEDPFVREEHPDYAHRMLHIFLCEPDDTYAAAAPSDMDYNMVESVWVPVDKVDTLTLEPVPLMRHFREVINGTAPFFLGTVYC